MENTTVKMKTRDLALYLVLTAYILITPCLTQDPQVLSSVCLMPDTNEFCYSLYGSDSRQSGSIAMDWDSANDKCKLDNKHLASVDTPQVQDIVSNMVSSINSDLDQVWIAGRRRHLLKQWAYLNNTEFTDFVKESFNNNCLKRYMDKHGLIEYREIRCTDNWNVYALCQYNGAEDACRGVYYNNMCYIKSNMTMNWFQGMSYCYSETGGAGTLAYVGLRDDALQVWLDSIRGDKYSLEVLVGIRRQPWVWVSETGDSPVMNFNWFSQSGYYSGDRCITVEPKESAQWKDVPCFELWYFYICQNGSLPTTTASTTTTTTTTTPSPTTITTTTQYVPQPVVPGQTSRPTDGGDQNSGVRSTTVQPGRGGTPSGGVDAVTTTLGPPQEQGGLKKEHIIAIVVGIIVIVLIVIIVISIQRCKRNRHKPEESTINALKKTNTVNEVPDVVIRDDAKQNGIVQNGIENNGKVKGHDVSDRGSDATPVKDVPRDYEKLNGTAVSPPSEVSQSIKMTDQVQNTPDVAPVVANNDTGKNELDDSLEDTAIWVAL